MIKTSRQLKALVRNKSEGNSEIALEYIRMYAMERFLERLSLSKYRDNFVLKGGVLVSSLVGISLRSTMDIDATICNYPLSEDEALTIIKDIAGIPLDDGMTFEVNGISPIMEEADYPGLRVSLTARLETMKTPLKIDISTGDAITPGAVIIGYKCLLEDRRIELYAYNLETLLSEKIETVLSRGTANSRVRDYYDIWIIEKLYGESINYALLAKAIENTSAKRGSKEVLLDSEHILDDIGESENMKKLWKNYQTHHNYADGIDFREVLESVRSMLRKV